MLGCQVLCARPWPSHQRASVEGWACRSAPPKGEAEDTLEARPPTMMRRPCFGEGLSKSARVQPTGVPSAASRLELVLAKVKARAAAAVAQG